MSTRTLVQLPPELLHHALSFLDSYDLVRVRKTCKTLKRIVDNSEMLQYIIDLGYFQMIPMGSSDTDVPPVTRRKRLRLYDAARQRVEFKLKYTLPFPMLQFDHIYAFGGGIYGAVVENCFHFARLPSDASDSGDVDCHCWSHPIDVTTLVNFTFCAAQDLLIVVARSPYLQSHVYDIYLRSLTTNDTHPDAAQPFLKALDRYGHQMQDSWHCKKLQIIGNYIGILCWAFIATVNDALDIIQVWDWKSKEGYQFILFFDYDISDYFFITENKFLVLVTSGSMEIYNIDGTSRVPQRTAIISLPSLVDGFSYTDVFTSDHLTPSSMFPYVRGSHRPPLCSFHPSADDQLIAILVWIHSTDTDHSYMGRSPFYRFVVQRSAILELESLSVRTYGQLSSKFRLLWSMWGPQHTSWFDIQLNNDWHTSVCGFRTIESIGEFSSRYMDNPRRLYIRDFNPHIAWNYDAVDQSGCCGKIIPGEMDKTVSHPFAEPLGRALTYRESVSEELFDVKEILSDESRVLVVKVSRNLPLIIPGDNESR
ncbi:hypothetical protein EDB19DRAFT_1632240 [Suillus lakei]|nr:hypothetical protein EDB19DRAFT_1632240 [Suillus lakei]